MTQLPSSIFHAHRPQVSPSDYVIHVARSPTPASYPSDIHYSQVGIEYLCRSHQSGEGHVAPVLEVLLGLSEPVRKVQGIEIDLRYTISEDGEDLRSETAWNHLTELLLKFPHSTDICLHLRQDERFPPFMRENYAAYKRLVEERRLWYKLGSARGRQRVVLNPGYVAKDSGDCEDKGEGGSDSHT